MTHPAPTLDEMALAVQEAAEDTEESAERIRLNGWRQSAAEHAARAARLRAAATTLRAHAQMERGVREVAKELGDAALSSVPLDVGVRNCFALWSRRLESALAGERA